MQSLFGNPPSTPLVWAAAFLIIFVLLALFAMVLRKLAGARLNMAAGGRTRQPRLGIVDAFDLDRQRQLVIVRRDNVEHLVMIGGPNDLVIEQGIIRSGGAVLREPGEAVRPEAPRVEPTMAAMASARSEPPVGEPAPMAPPVFQQPVMPPVPANAEPPARLVAPPPPPVQPSPITAVPPPLRESARSMPPPPPPLVRPPGPAPAPVLRPSPDRRPPPVEPPAPAARNSLPPLPETVVDPRRADADRVAAAAAAAAALTAAAAAAQPIPAPAPEQARSTRDVAPPVPEPVTPRPVVHEPAAPEPVLPLVEPPAPPPALPEPPKANVEAAAPPPPPPPPPAPVATPEMDDMARRLEEALKKPFAGIKSAESAKPATPAPAPAPAQAAPAPAVAAPTAPKSEPPVAVAPPAQAPPPPAPAAKPVPAPIEVADFDSLEAEMSRLLGRDPGAPKT